MAGVLLAGLKRQARSLFAVDEPQKAEQDDDKRGENEPWAGRGLPHPLKNINNKPTCWNRDNGLHL